MMTQHEVARQRVRVWALRITLFASGACILVLSFISGYLGPIGLFQGGALIVLSLLASAAVRHPLGWFGLTLTLVGTVLPFIGSGVVFGLAGGNQNSTLGGIGFMIVLFGVLMFATSAIATMALALRVYVQEWRARHGKPVVPPVAPR